MESKDFKKLLENVSSELYRDVAKLLAQYGIEDVKVDRIRVTPLEEIEDEQECIDSGGIWQCDIVPGQPPYCRCLKKR